MPKKAKASVLPTLDRWGGRQRVVRKAATSELLDNAPDRIAAELMDIGYSSVAEVFDWDEGAGSFRLKAKREISAGALRSIKRVKVQRRRKIDDNGDTIMDENIEVEFHDKIAALRLMAQAGGMLNKEKNTGIPSITGIELKGPSIKAVEQNAGTVAAGKLAPVFEPQDHQPEHEDFRQQVVEDLGSFPEPSGFEWTEADDDGGDGQDANDSDHLTSDGRGPHG